MESLQTAKLRAKTSSVSFKRAVVSRVSFSTSLSFFIMSTSRLAAGQPRAGRALLCLYGRNCANRDRAAMSSSVRDYGQCSWLAHCGEFDGRRDLTWVASLSEFDQFARSYGALVFTKAP